MASALRLRILRMTLDEPLTNKEIADRLGRNPASVLHHVRTLARLGFLAAMPARSGTRGAREIPYRATRKSWYLEGPHESGSAAMVQAFVDEIRQVGTTEAGLVRLGLRLRDDEQAELHERLMHVVNEYAERPPTPGGRPWSLFLALHPDPSRD
jgi:predicted ArsR family transcriptional regulator